MSLQELGERELRDAMERQEREKIAEEEEKKKPRKYEYLVKDGLEVRTGTERRCCTSTSIQFQFISSRSTRCAGRRGPGRRERAEG